MTGTTPAPARTDLPAWAHEWTEAWNTHSGAAVARLLDPEVSYTDMGLGEHFTDPSEVAGFVDAMSRVMSSDFVFHSHAAVEQDGRYALEWTCSGTNDRPDPERGLPATGRPFTLRGLSIGLRRAGRIVENRDYWNLADYLAQIGLMPRS